MDASSRVNWDSQESHLILNPHLEAEEQNVMKDLFQEFNVFPAHIWLASSGSSQKSDESLKLIAISKKSLINSAQAVCEYFKFTSKDVFVQVLPEFHVGGLSVWIRALQIGATVTSGLKNQKWVPEYFVQICEEKKVTCVSLVPTQLHDVVERGLRAPASLKQVIVGGSALSSHLAKAAYDLGWNGLASFGMTESGSQIATVPTDGILEWLKDPWLTLLPHVQVREEEGLLFIKSNSLLTGYAQTKAGIATFCDPKYETWLRTSDYAEVNGRKLKILGRDRDFLKILGEGLHLGKLEIEVLDLAKQLGFSGEFCLLSRVHSRKGHEIFLATTEDNAETGRKLLSEFNKKARGIRQLTDIHLVRTFPKSPLGKILKERITEKLL